MSSDLIIKTKVKELIEEALKVMELDYIEDTPRRIAKMWVDEMFANRNNQNIGKLNNSLTLFRDKSVSSEMVIMKDIEFHSTCEHHFLPFSGKITIGYVPYQNIVGLSKIPRVVKFFSKKPQLQERLVKEIGDYLEERINPLSIFIYAEAIHSCVACRGVESSCSTVTTYCLRNSLVEPVNYVRGGVNYYEYNESHFQKDKEWFYANCK